MTQPRFSIVIPTHQRRFRVIETVRVLAGQELSDFEVLVVDDGSTDGTAEALARLEPPFPLTILVEANAGAAAARNAGASAARGEILLFLDDDMAAHARMLAEHDRSHRAGADAVLGDIPLHPSSPDNVLSRGVGQWARKRSARLAATSGLIPLADLLTGQFSVKRHLFERLGGFDAALTREGRFGGEDVEFGQRLFDHGARIVFNPSAISHQYYDVDPARFLRRVYEAGRGAQEIAFKHPNQAAALEATLAFPSRRSRLVFRPLVLAPSVFSWPLRSLTARLMRSRRDSPRVRHLFAVTRKLEHVRGVQAARRAGDAGRAVVLAYHAISDLGDDPVLGLYGVPPELFARQLDGLLTAGWTFLSLDVLLAALRGERSFPKRAVHVTFDDGYADLLAGALPVLSQRDIPATVFVVAGLLGQTNAWDSPLGAPALPLLDAPELQELAGHGIEIGSHGVRHRRLTDLDSEDLREELEASARLLRSAGLGAPRALAYPHGATNQAVSQAAQRAGYEAAFTVQPGVVRRESPRWVLPRLEVTAADSAEHLLLRVETAAWPARSRSWIAAVRGAPAALAAWTRVGHRRPGRGEMPERAR